jgi:hypothetical protein
VWPRLMGIELLETDISLPTEEEISNHPEYNQGCLLIIPRLSTSSIPIFHIYTLTDRLNRLDLPENDLVEQAQGRI